MKNAFNKQKEEAFYKFDNYIIGKEDIKEKLKEIHVKKIKKKKI